VQPEAFAKGEEKKAVATFALERGSAVDAHFAGLHSRPSPRANDFLATGTASCDRSV